MVDNVERKCPGSTITLQSTLVIVCIFGDYVMKETTEHYNQKTSSTAALIVGSLALFSDNLVVGLAVPVLPVLPSVVETGAARTGILFASYSISVVLAAVFAGKFVDKYVQPPAGNRW